MAVRVCRVALTGGVASGKSTVARMLAERGAAVCDADRIVHELYRSGGQGAAVVGRLFGSGVLAADGSVDTVALGELVLADPRALARLNAAVHPLVRTRLQGWLAELKGSNIAVVEAALVMEAGTAGDYDVIAVVWCTRDQQLERARARGVAADRAHALLAAQMPLDEKRRLADVVIDNSGAQGDLDGEVNGAWRALGRVCRERLRCG
jgi:dephospho-CoA kinase